MSAPAPEWVSVGYIALTAAEFQDLRRYTLNARGGESLELMLEPEFHAKTFETPMQAMLQQRKERVRKLGGAPSESDKAVKMYLRAAGTKVADAIQSANFVILHLQTKDNIADALSRRELVYQDTGSYTVASWMSPFEELPFKDKSKWMLTVQLPSCTKTSVCVCASCPFLSPVLSSVLSCVLSCPVLLCARVFLYLCLVVSSGNALLFLASSRGCLRTQAQPARTPCPAPASLDAPSTSLSSPKMRRWT